MLPLELNKLLIIVVVLSMALTPLLNEAGKRAAAFIDDKFNAENVCFHHEVFIIFQIYVHTNHAYAYNGCR